MGLGDRRPVVCPTLAMGFWVPLQAALRVCSVLGRLAPVHRCARAVCGVVSAVSWATWLLFTGVRAVSGARVPWVVVSLFLPP